MTARAAFAGWLSAALLCAQEPGDEASLAACRVLAAAQDRGALTVEAVVAALGGADEPVARTAAAIVRHEWAELPPALFDALDGSPAACRMLLRELAQAPRPAAAAWAERRALAAPGRTPDDRCLALAARGAPLRAADAEILLAALTAREAGDGFRAALVVLPERVADGLLGKVHGALQQGAFAVDDAMPLLERMSATGLRGLLGLVRTLPAEVAAPLASLLYERRRDLVLAQAAATLDAPGGLELVWVPWCGAVLDRPERVARVRMLLGDPAVAVAVQQQAFGALVDAQVVDDAVLAYAELSDQGMATRLRRLLDVAPDRVPAARLLRWLDLDTEAANLVVRALPRRRALEAELERRLAAELRLAGTADGDFCRPAAEAIAHRGGPEGLAQVWSLMRASPGWSEFLDALARRRDPFVHERLLAELQERPADIDADLRQQQLDHVALALAARGDRRELQRLVDHAGQSQPGFVRRCSHHVRPVPATAALQLLDRALAVPATIAAEVALEMVTWAATAKDDREVCRRLRAIRATPPAVAFAEELQEIVLRALATSSERANLVAELRQALAAGPLPAHLEPLPFELLASMAEPPVAADLAFAAELVLLAPRTDPAGEAARARRWPDGTFGFPLVAAVAERLRAAAPELTAVAFAQASAAALADRAHTAIAPSRLLVLWRELAVAPAVQAAVGGATAALFLALPARGAVGDGPAHWFAARAALERGEFAAARTHALAARDSLLRLPTARRHARLFLGDRDPGAGRDPWAALAALPHACAWREAAARDDGKAAVAAARLVREFAGHDVSLLAGLPVSPVELTR